MKIGMYKVGSKNKVLHLLELHIYYFNIGDIASEAQLDILLTTKKSPRRSFKRRKSIGVSGKAKLYRNISIRPDY